MATHVTIAVVKSSAKTPHAVGIRSTLLSSSVAYYAFTGGMHKPRVEHHITMKVICNALPRRSPLIRVNYSSLVSGRSVPQ